MMRFCNRTKFDLGAFDAQIPSPSAGCIRSHGDRIVTKPNSTADTSVGCPIGAVLTYIRYSAA